MMRVLLRRELGGIWVVVVLLVFGVGPYLVALGVGVGRDGGVGDGSSVEQVLAFGSYRPVPYGMLESFIVPLLVLPAVGVLLGVVRQWHDRRSRESAFLVGEGATRVAVFWSRAIAGVVMLGLLVGVIALGFELILRGQLRAVEGAWLVLWPRFAVLGAFVMAAYFVGLWMGQHERFELALHEAVFTVALLFLVILIKGYTGEAVAWLALAGAGALMGGWARYRHRPL